MTENYQVQWSKPEDQRSGTDLVVLLHGYGSHEQDLMGLVPSLPQNVTYASLRAPVELAPGAYTWFPLDVERMAYSTTAARDAVEGVWAWIAGVKDQFRSVSILGFSMGMFMATSLIRSRPQEFACAVGLSGFAVDAEQGEGFEGYFHDDELAAAKFPFFWGRDQEDPVIPAEHVEYTHQWATQTVKLTKVLYSGVGHGVAPQEVKHVGEFLQMMLTR